MTRAEIYDTLTETEQIVFLLGAMYYDDDTDNGKVVLAIDKARDYPDVVLRAVLYFLMTDDTDFVTNTVALGTAEVCATVLAERDTGKRKDIKARWEEFKHDYFKEGLDNG